MNEARNFGVKFENDRLKAARALFINLKARSSRFFDGEKGAGCRFLLKHLRNNALYRNLWFGLHWEPLCKRTKRYSAKTPQDRSNDREKLEAAQPRFLCPRSKASRGASSTFHSKLKTSEENSENKNKFRIPRIPNVFPKWNASWKIREKRKYSERKIKGKVLDLAFENTSKQVA